MTVNTNEWEFQGALLSWISEELSARPYGFGSATQEFANADGKRSDIIVWIDRGVKEAILEIELKTPTTPLSDPEFQKDAVKKAHHVNAPYVALWNMRYLGLYRTPKRGREHLLPSDFVATIGEVPNLHSVGDWIDSTATIHLKKIARDLLVAAYDLHNKGSVGGVVIDATVFTGFLAERVAGLRKLLRSDFTRNLGRDRRLQREINEWASKQGLTTFVDDLYTSLSAQLAYRVVGQALFYHAFRKREPALEHLKVDEEGDVSSELRGYWDAIRAFDYEALYEASPLESVPLGDSSKRHLGKLVNDLSNYDWGKIDDDVLGTVFEQLIPERERIALGQYYTRPELADFMLSFCQIEGSQALLDPAVGTGTFLMRAHDRLQRLHGVGHDDALSRLWGFDVSAFPAELAVINLCRLDLDSAENYPRIAVRDFFDVSVNTTLEFPPARRNPGSTVKHSVSLPDFHAVVGNPPYVRSQQLDDLDAKYKSRLEGLLRAAGFPTSGKLDAFGYFFVHAEKFLVDGGRLAFVTSAAWLSSSYGLFLQRFLIERFQPIAFVWSATEPFFPSVSVDTVVTVVEKLPSASQHQARKPMRFITLKKGMDDLLPPPDAVDYWLRTDSLVDALEAAADSDTPDYRVRVVDTEQERAALRSNPREPRNWVRYLKETPIYLDLFGGD